jgi:hypothetical protein
MTAAISGADVVISALGPNMGGKSGDKAEGRRYDRI